MKRPIITYHHFTKASFVLMLLVLYSCSTKRALTTKEQLPLENTPKLLFLNYTIEKVSSHNKRITLVNKIVANGRLKRNHQKLLNKPSAGDLKCSQLNKNSTELNTIYIKNPLIKIIESLDDSLSFSKLKIEQNKAPISLKLQLHPHAKFVSFSTFTDSINVVEISKTRIE